MKVHHITYPSKLPVPDAKGYALAVGFFDGLHKGHQQLINEAIRSSQENHLRAAVMTFDPHPSVVLGGKKEEIFYITPLNQKLELLEQQGVDDVFVVRFTSNFASLTPEAFIQQFVLGLNVKHVIAGFDFSFGAFGKGNMELMKKFASDTLEVTVIPKFTKDEKKVSSTRIRNELKAGNMQLVCDLLGRPFQLDGVVVHGDKRGRTIQFPTANVEPDEGQFIPAVGVYTVRMQVQDDWFDGVCNVGYKPTVQNSQKVSIEVHLFEFNRDIYGEQVRIRWYEPIRKEQKFPSLEALKDQIAKDKEQAIAYLAARPLS